MKDLRELNIPDKANKILNLILIAFILIAGRLWHLTVIQHDDKVQDSRKPGKKTEAVQAKRATIRDRFNLPLAINKLRYQAAILYSDMKKIPSIQWVKGEGGKKTKVYKRREYIKQLSEMLAKELGLDPSRLEDEIHAKASLFTTSLT